MSYISTSYPPSSSPTTPRKDPASSPSTHTSHRYPSDSLSHLHVDLGAARNPPADLDHLSRPIPPPPPSAESPRSAQSFPPRPSSVHRRQSSYLRKLELNAELERKQFGLTDVCVSTSPGPGPDCPDSTDEITIDLSLTPTPRAATMSHATTHHQSGGSLAAPQLPIARTPTPAMNVPSSRTRNPVPPSPLSKVSSPSDEPTAFPEPSPTTQLSPPALHHAQTSPCFIHSHLDRHGSLQDWLAHKTNTSSDQNGNGPSKPKQRAPEPKQFTANRHSHSPHHAPHHRHHTSATPSGPSSQPATPRREPSGSGYESDKSSANGHQSLSGSAVLDGDFLEDEEEGGSLTKQLAETAQGVREMSKELGRTRVRSRIQHVLVVTKARDNRLIQLTRELALYLMQKRPVSSPDGRNSDRGMVVYVDAQLRHSKRFDAAGIQRDYPDLFQPIHRRRSSSSASLTAISAFPSTSSMSDFSRRPRDEGQLRYWTSEMCSNSPHLFDFVVTLGGDGTVLFTSWLFQKIVPPVLPFALGSLGFLTNFDFAQYKRTMDKVVDDGIRVNLRMRFTCTVYRAIAPEEAARAAQQGGRKRKAIKKPGGEILINQVDRSGWESLEGPSSGGVQPCQPCQEKEDKEIMCYTTRPVEQFEVLNDLVVDRGPSPYVSLLELFGDEHHLTTVQADGLTVSTPTGSTAYSLSAGGSLVHPQIPALLITPICPHTLSFRPMLLPDSMELRICVPYNSRSTAWASFDGRGRVELKQGDHIKVTASKYPFPTVCADKASTDWFSSISRTLRWNEREKQKSFVVVEEENEPVDKRRAKKKVQIKPDYAEIKKNGPDAIKEVKEFHEDEDSEEEEEYDIDDKSGGDVTPLSPKEHEPPINPHKLSDMLSGHKSGVDTPDRYVTHCSAPPPLSQRHLIDALAAAEIKEKENEMGQRDHIRAGASEMRTDGTGHLIPPGRSHLRSPEGRGGEAQRTPKASKKRLSGELKSKAFAFFGQDDSASDVSDDLSE